MAASPADSDRETKALQDALKVSGAKRRQAAEHVKAVAGAALAATPLNGTPILRPTEPDPGFDPCSSTELRFDLAATRAGRRVACDAAKRSAEVAVEDAASQTRTMIFDRAKVVAPEEPTQPSPTTT